MIIEGNISIDDLDHILTGTTDIWDEVKEKNIFITGGTGFFGKWLLESFIYINEKLTLNATLYVLSRDPEAFLKKYPNFNYPAIYFIKGDITEFIFPDVAVDYIIHAATEASVSLNTEQPVLMFDTIVNGTRRVLELAKTKKVSAVLHISSGAVYGVQPPDITHITEDYKSCPNIFSAGAAYGEGKRVAEMLSSFYFEHYGVLSKIARCFAFAGPYLPLDTHFAIGNFIRDLIYEKPIKVIGDGTPYRSYLYAADLVIWLWIILINGKPCMPYNVGSDEDITIAELAKMIGAFNNQGYNVVIKEAPDKKNPPQRYVPDISRAKNELNLRVGVPLMDAIKKTIEFYTIHHEY